MWSGLTIIPRSIICSTVWAPSEVSPRVLQWGAGGYAGAVPGGAPRVVIRVARNPVGAPVKISLSCSGVRQVSALQNEPELSLLPALIRAPTSPLSKRTPVSGLSNLLRSSDERTPRL